MNVQVQVRVYMWPTKVQNDLADLEPLNQRVLREPQLRFDLERPKI